MAVFVRTKRVTDPLDDKVRARLMASYTSSSGSEHETGDPSFFSGLIHAFLENDGPGSVTVADEAKRNGDSDSEDRDDAVGSAEMVRGLLEMSVRKGSFGLRLLSDVCKVAEALAWLRSSSPGYHRSVMGRLRELGYNAGLCKSRWETCGGLTAGSYEYIDVMTTKSSSEERYIVDLDFAGQFEIARATEEYSRVVEELPRVMVGTAEEVRQLVRVMADAARRSLRRRHMHVPPWRKTRYMLAKWLGPYRRTINPIPSSTGTSVTAGAADVKCRAVGFHAATRLVIPPSARTR